jgi:hypothetical protein
VRPLLFLDLDDVLCVNSMYGGGDVVALDKPADLWEKLFHPLAVATLLELVDEVDPRIVMTTSWARFLEHQGFVDVFDKTGLSAISARLHEHGVVEPLHGATRGDAIDRWMAQHFRGELYAILDDKASGTGLKGSRHDKARRVVWCEVGVGLHRGHLPMLRRALTK